MKIGKNDIEGEKMQKKLLKSMGGLSFPQHMVDAKEMVQNRIIICSSVLSNTVHGVNSLFMDTSLRWTTDT